MIPRDVPLIYSPMDETGRLPVAGRLLAMGISLGCLTVLLIAAHLVPSPDGFGTHLALGLKPCEFLQRTGIPCPSCGMTTSFAWFVRGNLAASLYVQPMGTTLAAISVIVFWSGLYIAATGRPAQRLLSFYPVQYYFLWLLGLATVAWAWKIFIHLRHLDGWRI